MSSVIKTLSRRHVRLLLVALALGATGAGAGPAWAVEPAKLSVTMKHANQYGLAEGTDFYSGSGASFARASGGNTYTITITNEGGTPTSGPVKVVDELPAGLTLLGEVSSGEGREHVVEEIGGPFWRKVGSGLPPCTITKSGQLVECTVSQALEPHKSYEPLTLQVAVERDALPPFAGAPLPFTNTAKVTNKVNVSGGGSISTGEAEDETTITPAVPFGIFSMTVSDLQAPTITKEQPPETQAGGHPFQYTTNFVFNYATRGTIQAQKHVIAVSDGPREIYSELPPGFVGNVLNTPRCPLALLFERHCPSNTVVGFINASTEGAIGAHGVVQPIFEKVGVGLNGSIYNMQPAPGEVAALGFTIINKSAFTLEASVRSDGDYGVNVGQHSVSTSSPRLLDARVTTCGNGAHEVPGTSGGEFACNTVAEAYMRPFLINPTECTSREEGKTAAPATVARADAWDEPEMWGKPEQYAATEGYNNASSPRFSEVMQPPTRGAPVKSSLFTGCDQLKFNPDIAFGASSGSEGGTTQADEPTGITFGLHVPQTPEEANEKVTPALRDVTMTLPEGLTVSPSAANGLAACTKEEFGLGTEFGPGSKHTEPANAARCPKASKIGTVEVFTPLLSGAPTIEGELAVGHSLKCSPGAWSVDATYSFQWLREGQPIANATGSEYAPTTEDKATTVAGAKVIQCQVTATNAGGSSVAVSREAVPPSSVKTGTGPEGHEPPQPSLPPPNIARPSGNLAEGEPLTCQKGVWTESPTLSYKWLRDGAPIGGAEAETYTLTAADAGKVIQCQVIASNIRKIEVEEEKPPKEKLTITGGGVVLADSAGVVVPTVPTPAPPLPGGALQGEVFVGQPECSPCSSADAKDGKLFPLFIQAQNLQAGVTQDQQAGVILKLYGKTEVDESTGRLTSVFEQQPEQPFELFALKLKGGPRAPLANPQTCTSTEQTEATLIPWSAAGKGGIYGDEVEPGSPQEPTQPSPYTVTGCPTALPFAPMFNAGTEGPSATTAGAYTEFAVTFGRHDGEQDLSGVTVHMPPGLVGRIPAVKECGEAEVHAAENNTGECPAASEIGTATTLAGPGGSPFPTTGHVYLTGPTKLKDGLEGPFGLAVVTLAKAGPFNLGNVVVRSAIDVDPHTAAVTVTSDQLPQIVSGVPIRLREVNVHVNKAGFMLNPTNCAAQQVSVTLTGLQGFTGPQGATAQLASPMGIGGCTSLPFAPTFTATTQAHTSKNEGASLDVKVTYPAGAYANIAKTLTELPAALPSRLTTLQKACVDSVFEANPAACPEGSVVGSAIAHTPVLNSVLSGPAYLVSHGGAAFPDLEIVLQGEGVKVILDGQSDIKKGITKTTFNALPDSPISSFELNLPEGPHSVLAANTDLCAQPLNLPTILTGQNGAVIKQNTHIAVTGCPPTVSLANVKIKGNALLVTVKTSAAGTVKINGKGLKTVSRKLTAGAHQVRVALTKYGRSLRKHHKKVSVHVRLTVGKQAVAKAMAVRL